MLFPIVPVGPAGATAGRTRAIDAPPPRWCRLETARLRTAGARPAQHRPIADPANCQHDLDCRPGARRTQRHRRVRLYRDALRKAGRSRLRECTAPVLRPACAAPATMARIRTL